MRLPCCFIAIFMLLSSLNEFFVLSGSSVITNTIPANSGSSPKSAKEAPESQRSRISPEEVIKKVKEVLPDSNVGVAVAIVSLSITLLCSVCIACKKCRKRGKGNSCNLIKKMVH